MDLTWNVYVRDMNNDDIIMWNVFNHAKFKEDTLKLLLEATSKEKFSEKLSSTVLYYFWSKYEYEIWIYRGRDNNDARRVDVANQLVLNWDVFVDYLWSKLHYQEVH